MSRYDGGWAPYVPVAERRRRALREVAKLNKKGHPVAPVIIEGRAIATTFWGKAWCQNLENYHDFRNRLARGRTYVRNGSVVDLQIAPLSVNALVSGSSIYKISINIASPPQPHWQSICQDCAGCIDSLVELLQGRFSKGVMERLCRQDRGLFPRPSEISFSCSCPDFASMCKHVAAVLYGVGARLDEKPELLFRLRAVDEKDLLDAAAPLSTTEPAAGKILETDDISALFDLEMASGDTQAPATAPLSMNTQARPRLPESMTPSAKQVPLRKPAQSSPNPVKVAAPSSIIHEAACEKHAGKHDQTGEPAGISPLAAAPAKPGAKKPSARPAAMKTALELTQDGFVKWWK